MASSVAESPERRDEGRVAAVGRRSPWLDPPVLVFAAAIVVLVTFLMHQSRGTTFFFDEWNVWSGRYGFTDLDRPFGPINGHLSAVPILIFSVITKVFGAENFLPFRISVVAYHVAFLTLLFVFARRRLGGWIALAAVAPMAVPAAAWIVLLMPFTGLFQIGPLIAALGAILALERGTRLWDAVAMLALLVLGILTAGSGLAALAAVAVFLLAVHGVSRDLLARAWVVGVPAATYLVWWLHYRPDTESEASNVAFVGGYVVRGLDSGIGSYLTISNWASTISLVMVALAVLTVWRWRATAPLVLAMAAGAVGFWALIALARAPDIGPEQERYVYANAALALLLALALLPAVRPSLKPAHVLIAYVLVVPIVLSQVSSFRAQASNYRSGSLIAKTDLFVLNATRDTIDPAFVFPDGDPQIAPGPYLSARRLWGGPAGLSEADVASAAAGVASRADKSFMAVHNIHLVGPGDPSVLPGPSPEPPRLTGAAAEPRGDCVRITPTAGQADARFELHPPSGLLIRARGGAVHVRIARFANMATVTEFGTVGRQEERTVAFPADRANHPWQIYLLGEGAFTVCGARPA